ncbi:family 78 glycoside hydrolase catalytic domain [Amycolatopsis sp. NPDC088138]|uniref:family 78 glycoside hydrolase catalytic domain n=1 Tax=Amycolatopsis sp. NPDC088138 TaxID=3363938 RepID=UPI0038222C46
MTRRTSATAALVVLLLALVQPPASAAGKPSGPDLGKGDWVGLADPVWTDYTVDVDLTVVREAASLYFRTQGNAGNSYMWQINVTGAVPVLKKHVWAGGGVASVSETPLDIGPGAIHASHHLRVTAAGSTITTAVDGVTVDTTQDSTYTQGSIGFRESPTEDATYRGLTVTSSTGQQLFHDAFTPGEPNAFSGGTIGADGLDVTNGDALLKPDGGTPRVRDEFSLRKKVKSAQLYSSALGIYEISINGKRVGDDLFAPGWTNYRTMVQYQSQDVTSLLGRGANAIAAQLAPGWYAGDVGWFGPGQYDGTAPALWAQLRITYTDGSAELVTTDNSWQASKTGPVTAADNYQGESYDARKEQPGWDRPGFTGAGWSPVTVLPSRSSRLVPQIGPPVRVTGTVRPIGVSQPKPGTYVFDLGQDISGVVRLRLTGAAGTTVTLRHAQAVNPDGSLYTDNLAAGPAPYRYAAQTDTFTLRGGGPEAFQPDYTYHGFRYVEVTGYPGKPALADVTGVVEGTDAPVIGDFSTSDPMINKLQSNITWSERDNLFSVPTDTNARTERLGWAGDADFFAPTATFNRDLDGFYTKWERDLIDSQTADGVFGNVAPLWTTAGGYGGGWGDAGVVIPYVTWQSYGDLDIVRTSYPAMRKYVDAMRAKSTGLILPADFAPAGDWMNVGQPTPNDLIATAYFAYDTRILARMADAIGNHDDAAAYDDLADQVTAAWNARYVAADGSIAGTSQTAYVLALHLGLLPSPQRPAAADRLVGLIHAAGDHLTTGFVGTQWLLPVLSGTGHTDVAYTLLEQTTYPSWGYEIAHGATTVWERWDGILPGGGFNPNLNGNSFNHAVDGAVGTWMYTTVAGLTGDPAHPGYQRFSVHPQPGGGLTHANASLRTRYGTIGSGWRIEGRTLVLDVTVPPGTTATIDVPAVAANRVSGGRGARFGKFADGYATYTATGGHYTFVASQR